jgi:hypothetical protein
VAGKFGIGDLMASVHYSRGIGKHCQRVLRRFELRPAKDSITLIGDWHNGFKDRPANRLVKLTPIHGAP